MYDFLIVGCGLTGATLAERIANELDQKVLIVDRRDHIGGNCYDYYDEHGILVSKYGAHIFHTKSERVWEYVNRFAEFSDYIHTVDAKVGERFYSIPLNLDSINAFFGLNLTEKELPSFLNSIRVHIDNPSNAEEVVLSKVGRELYEAFYKNYTIKQWGIDPKHLEPSVTERLQIRMNRDRRYFLDPYQGMPVGGYTQMIKKMLTHRNIEVLLNTDYRKIINETGFDKLIFTGPIDQFFDYCYGELPYRSLRFEFITYNQEYYQHTGVINYPNEFDYTRTVEYKYLYNQKHDKTTVSREYPCWNHEEPYYPVPSSENHRIYGMYRRLAEGLRSVYFCGRLGTYRYLNMDQCIEQALDLLIEIKKGEKRPLIVTR